MEATTSTDQQLEAPELALTTTTSTEEMAAPETTLATASAMEEVTIAELRVKSYDAVLEARVYRKWIAVTYQKNGKKTETGLCCILIDKKGDAIQGNMNIRDFDHFNPKINIGQVYKISEFMCEPTNPYQQTISNRLSLRFGKVTKFDLTTTTSIPHHYFEFVAYNQLQSKIPKQDGTGKIQYPVLTDYIGCLGSVGELKEKGGPNEDLTIYRKVDIENLNGNVVEFTMWDDAARNFERTDLETLEKPIIIAVSSCRVSKYRDYQLTATSATCCYLNPDIPEARQSKEQYRARHSLNPPLRICKTPYDDIEKEKFRNRFPLKTLLKQSPDSYRGVQFTTEATITSINVRRDWCYMSCNECASKVKDDDGVYRCLNHGKQPKPSYRYNFKAFITDPSATAEVTFFTPAANEVTGYTCPQLVTNHKGADLQEIPPEIFAIEGEKNIFQIHFSTSANTTSFVLDQVFQKKKCYDTVTTAIDPNLATPPSTLAITSHEYSGEMKGHDMKSKGVKRALFQAKHSNEIKSAETSNKTMNQPPEQHEKRQKTTLETYAEDQPDSENVQTDI